MAPEDEADVFAIPELWQTSRWLNNLSHNAPSSFFLNELKGNVASLWKDPVMLNLASR